MTNKDACEILLGLSRNEQMRRAIHLELDRLRDLVDSEEIERMERHSDGFYSHTTFTMKTSRPVNERWGL